jgi:hypothetical protein
MQNLLFRLFEDKHGYGSSPLGPTGGPKGRNIDSIYRDQFRSLFRGPLESIHIYYPEGFRGDDLGAALARFPKLRDFGVFENDSGRPTEADWIKLCARLRRLSDMEKLNMGGEELTDSAIAELSGHPGLRVISISYCFLTTRCATTFATMPNLTELNLEKPLPHDASAIEPWEFSQKDRENMTAALPKVRVGFSASQ